MWGEATVFNSTRLGRREGKNLDKQRKVGIILSLPFFVIPYVDGGGGRRRRW